MYIKYNESNNKIKVPSHACPHTHLRTYNTDRNIINILQIAYFCNTTFLKSNNNNSNYDEQAISMLLLLLLPVVTATDTGCMCTILLLMMKSYRENFFRLNGNFQRSKAHSRMQKNHINIDLKLQRENTIEILH